MYALNVNLVIYLDIIIMVMRPSVDLHVKLIIATIVIEMTIVHAYSVIMVTPLTIMNATITLTSTAMQITAILVSHFILTNVRLVIQDTRLTVAVFAK